MKSSGNAAVVAVNSGNLRGTLNDAVCIFKGVPYGERIDSHRRASEIGPPASWVGELDTTALGKVFPQLRSRLAAVMGDGIDANPQSEDAFVLNVWAPADASTLPVLVFIHGGGFVSGGGSASWYDGERLAREGNIVVVTVNYRLGALAHHVDGTDATGANRPVRDLLRALEWVQENIARFGGNPDNVTVGGQSAGAWYAWLLGVSPASRGLLHRNLLLSLPIMAPLSPDEVFLASRELTAFANGKSFESLPTAELLAAQTSLMRSRAEFGELTLPFRPAIEAGLVPEWLFDFRRAVQAMHVGETLIGSTAEESAGFMFNDPLLVNADEVVARAWFAKYFADDAPRVYAGFAQRRSQSTPYTQLVDAATHMTFGSAVEAISQVCGETGRAVYPFHFNVQSQVRNLMSPHCFELPFLFGNRRDWVDAPMLANTSDEVFERVGSELRAAVCGFVRDGVPKDPAEAPWRRHVPDAPALREIA